MDAQTCRTVDDVIEALGGNQAVSAITRSGPAVITNWKARRRFPARTFLILSDELTKRNCTAPSALWGIPVAAPKKNGSASGGSPQRRKRRSAR